MRSRDQVIWDFVQDWLTKADRDLRVAEFLIARPEVRVLLDTLRLSVA